MLAEPVAAPNHLSWQRLTLLRRQMRANLEALGTHEPELAGAIGRLSPPEQYVMAAEGNQIKIAVLDGSTARLRPTALTADAARQVLLKLCPSGRYTEPLLIAGVDQGWLVQGAYTLPVSSPLPGHRPPLYVLSRDLLELWIALHLHDWRVMLADTRVRWFVGPDAVGDFARSLVERPQSPCPRLSVTLDPAVWPAGVTLETVVAGARVQLNDKLQSLLAGYASTYQWATPGALVERCSGGRPLRVLGITSLHTTFLQYSMRDWLAAFDRMGHQTRLLIEDHPHEALTNYCFAKACAEFQPDLLLLIDHSRAEFGTLPAQIPAVMWVQDNLPNIFSSQGGAAQGPRDYCLGFGRLFLSLHHGYPEGRFMEAIVGVNEERFVPLELSPDEIAQYGADVAYVGHASTPADVLLKEKLAELNSPDGTKLFTDMYDRVTAGYENGQPPFHRLHFQQILNDAIASTGIAPANAAEHDATLNFFTHKINNALFRHQTLNWLADLDVNIALYGRGWENHPRLKRFARGVADNQKQLTLIYQASKINLQVTPHGAVHQRLFEGLAAGGFFLLRYFPGDVIERVYRPMWEWVVANGVRSNDEFYARATPAILELDRGHREIYGLTMKELAPDIVGHLRLSADSGWTRSAASIWPEYGAVSFDSREALHGRVRHYLADDALRRRTAAAMRGPVLERFTYLATSRRLVRFIADDLRRQAARSPAGAAT